jgi:hypothetical protein
LVYTIIILLYNYMSNLNGFIITGLILGIVTLTAGGYFLSKNKTQTNATPNINFNAIDKNDEGYFYSGGKKTKKHRYKHKCKHTCKHHNK